MEYFHPGRELQGVLNVLNISQKTLAERISMHTGQLNEVINGKRPIGVDMAFRLEKVMLYSAEYWLMLQLKYDIQEYRKINQPYNT